MDLGIFADRSVAYLYAAGFLSAFATYAVVLLASLYLQSGRGLTALHAGLMVVPAPIGTTLAALVAGRLTNRIHHGLLSAAGCVLIAAGAATVGGSVWLGTRGGDPGLAAGLFVVGFGTGLFMTPNTSALMLTVAPERRGIANAVRSTLQNAGYLFSTSVSLGLATVLLGDADRSLAYAGTLSTSGGDVRAFVGGLMVALAVLVAAAALGALASLRTRRFAAAPSPATAAEGPAPMANQPKLTSPIGEPAHDGGAAPCARTVRPRRRAWCLVCAAGCALRRTAPCGPGRARGVCPGEPRICADPSGLTRRATCAQTDCPRCLHVPYTGHTGAQNRLHRLKAIAGRRFP